MNWESGQFEPRTGHLRELARVFGIPFDYMLDEHSEPIRANVGRGPGLHFLVPVVGWDQVVRVIEKLHDQGDVGIESDAFIPCPVVCGPRTFALRVLDDSMTATGGLSYRRNALIFVDPDASHAIEAGDRILARIADGETVFACYEPHAGRPLLRFLNPAFPTITGAFEILGRVIGQFSE